MDERNDGNSLPSYNIDSPLLMTWEEGLREIEGWNWDTEHRDETNQITSGQSPKTEDTEFQPPASIQKVQLNLEVSDPSLPCGTTGTNDPRYFNVRNCLPAGDVTQSENVSNIIFLDSESRTGEMSKEGSGNSISNRSTAVTESCPRILPYSDVFNVFPVPQEERDSKKAVSHSDIDVSTNSTAKWSSHSGKSNKNLPGDHERVNRMNVQDHHQFLDLSQGRSTLRDQSQEGEHITAMTLQRSSCAQSGLENSSRLHSTVPENISSYETGALSRLQPTATQLPVSSVYSLPIPHRAEAQLLLGHDCIEHPEINHEHNVLRSRADTETGSLPNWQINASSFEGSTGQLDHNRTLQLLARQEDSSSLIDYHCLESPNVKPVSKGIIGYENGSSIDNSRKRSKRFPSEDDTWIIGEENVFPKKPLYTYGNATRKTDAQLMTGSVKQSFFTEIPGRETNPSWENVQNNLSSRKLEAETDYPIMHAHGLSRSELRNLIDSITREGEQCRSEETQSPYQQMLSKGQHSLDSEISRGSSKTSSLLVGDRFSLASIDHSMAGGKTLSNIGSDSSKTKDSRDVSNPYHETTSQKLADINKAAPFETPTEQTLPSLASILSSQSATTGLISTKKDSDLPFPNRQHGQKKRDLEVPIPPRALTEQTEEAVEKAKGRKAYLWSTGNHPFELPYGKPFTRSDALAMSKSSKLTSNAAPPVSKGLTSSVPVPSITTARNKAASRQQHEAGVPNTQTPFSSNTDQPPSSPASSFTPSSTTPKTRNKYGFATPTQPKANRTSGSTSVPAKRQRGTAKSRASGKSAKEVGGEGGADKKEAAGVMEKEEEGEEEPEPEPEDERSRRRRRREVRKSAQK